MKAFRWMAACGAAAIAAGAVAEPAFRPLRSLVVDKRGVLMGPFDSGAVWLPIGPIRAPVLVPLKAVTITQDDGSQYQDSSDAAERQSRRGRLFPAA